LKEEKSPSQQGKQIQDTVIRIKIISPDSGKRKQEKDVRRIPGNIMIIYIEE
jgi:hypothetical protein